MKAFTFAESYLNSNGAYGEKELREYVAAGGDINERDREGMSAHDMATATHLHDKKMRAVAPALVKIIESLQN